MFDMIGNIFKNLGQGPATRCYPYEKRAAFQASRGRVRGIDSDKCIFCGICAKKCPADAIVVDRNSKTWEINPFKCVVCGACSEVCPKQCLDMEEAYTTVATTKDKLKFVQAPKKEEDTKLPQAG
jgi:Formate hydrogenlyase subunit 6/NADH:ubiquinone oxidoreductase 23 kD subunit (chain I)